MTIEQAAKEAAERIIKIEPWHAATAEQIAAIIADAMRKCGGECISTSERMPKPGKRIWFVAMHHGVNKGKFFEETDCFWSNDFDCDFVTDMVSHWMYRDDEYPAPPSEPQATASADSPSNPNVIER